MNLKDKLTQVNKVKMTPEKPNISYTGAIITFIGLATVPAVGFHALDKHFRPIDNNYSIVNSITDHMSEFYSTGQNLLEDWIEQIPK